jgi:hypothetical protein
MKKNLGGNQSSCSGLGDNSCPSNTSCMQDIYGDYVCCDRPNWCVTNCCAADETCATDGVNQNNNMCCPSGIFTICNGTCCSSNTCCGGACCDSGQECSQGQCVTPCGGGFCSQGEVCINGNCTTPPPPTVQCLDNTTCTSPETCNCIKAGNAGWRCKCISN